MALRKGKPPKIQLGPGVEQISLDALADELGLQARPYDPAKDRETARRLLAYGMLSLVSVVALAILGATFGDLISVSEAKDLAAFTLSPLVVLVGTVFGFYYGGHAQSGAGT